MQIYHCWPHDHIVGAAVLCYLPFTQFQIQIATSFLMCSLNVSIIVLIFDWFYQHLWWCVMTFFSFLELISYSHSTPVSISIFDTCMRSRKQWSNHIVGAVPLYRWKKNYDDMRKVKLRESMKFMRLSMRCTLYNCLSAQNRSALEFTKNFTAANKCYFCP